MNLGLLSCYFFCFSRSFLRFQSSLSQGVVPGEMQASLFTHSKPSQSLRKSECSRLHGIPDYLTTEQPASHRGVVLIGGEGRRLAFDGYFSAVSTSKELNPACPGRNSIRFHRGWDKLP